MEDDGWNLARSHAASITTTTFDRNKYRGEAVTEDRAGVIEEERAADKEETEKGNDSKEKKSWIWVVVQVLTLVVLAAFGTVILVSAFKIFKKTPQEKAATLHEKRSMMGDERWRGKPYPLYLQKLVLGGEQQAEADAEREYVLILHGIKASGDVWIPMIEKWIDAESRREREGTERKGKAEAAQKKERKVFLLPDLLGHGKSPWPDKCVKYTIKTHIDSLMDLLETHVPENATLHIAGHSLGALLALELASTLLAASASGSVSGAQKKQKWNVKTLILMSTPYFETKEEAEEAGKKHSFFFRHPHLHSLACGYLFCRQGWLWQRALKKKFKKMYPELPDTVFNNALQHSHHGVVSTVKDGILEHRLQDATQIIQRSGLPVLLIDGDRDDLCPPKNRFLLQKDLGLLCGAVVLKDAPHSFVASRIDETLFYLRGFVNQE